jgi:hypothetical protein
MLSKIGALVVATSMAVSGTVAVAAGANQGALAGGKPAGVKQAEGYMGQHQLLWLLGGGLVIGGIVLVATGNGHGTVGATCPLPGCTPPPPPTTTTETTETTETTATTETTETTETTATTTGP